MRYGTGWAEAERIAARLEERLGSFWREGNQKSVMEPAALAEADELRALVLRVPKDPAERDRPLYILHLPALCRVASLHYARCLVLGPKTDEALPDVRLTRELYVLIAKFAPEELPEDEELRQTVAAAHVPAVEDLDTTRRRALELMGRWQAAHDREALDRAISQWRGVRRVLPESHPWRPMLFSNLCAGLAARSKAIGDPADLEDAVELGRQAVGLAPADDPERGMYLTNLAFALEVRLARFGESADHDAAVDTARLALAAAPAASPERMESVRRLGELLRLRFVHRQDPRDIDESLSLLRQVVRDANGGGPAAFDDLFHLALVLRNRFHHTRDPADINEAIETARHSLAASSGASPELRGRILSLLGDSLYTRSERIGSPSDVDEAVTVLKKAGVLLNGFSPDELSECLSTLGLALISRFRTPSHADLDRAVDVSRQAVTILPADHPKRARRLSDLSYTLVIRYVLAEEVRDLDEAVQAGRQAVAAATAHDPAELANHLATLGIALGHRHRRSGGPTDLDESIDAHRASAGKLPDGHHGEPGYLVNLAASLVTRYERAGALTDLEEAIEAYRAALRDDPGDHPMRALVLGDLSNALRKRFERVGALSDLDEAIESSRSAIRDLPAFRLGGLEGAALLNTLSTALTARYKRVGAPSDLDEAIEVGRAAVRSVSESHWLRAVLLSDLALALHERGGSTARQPGDGDEAVDCMRQAVHCTPHDSPARAMYLCNLSMVLLVRVKDSPADVDEAAAAALAAVRTAPDDHPLRAQCLVNLGSALLFRWNLSRDADDLAMAFDLYREATRQVTAPASVRLQAARAWAMASVRTSDWAEGLDACRAAIAELPLLAWHGLDREDRLDALGRTASLACDAAAVALNAGLPEEALQLLEQGRGVLLAQALDARDDMTELREQAPELADQIREVRVLLDTSPAGPEPTRGDVDPAQLRREQRAEVERRRELAREMDDLVRRARELPGLADFLRPPSVERLRAAAENGPVVVVNTSGLRCDALIVTRDGLRTAPLPQLVLEGPGGLLERTGQLLDALASVGHSPADTWRAQRILLRTLSWLWDTVAAPVLAVLVPTGSSSGSEQRPSRLWWCPTGLLSLLPLHAAGHYGPEGPEAGAADSAPQALPDRYVCSYTTTLRALAAASRAGGNGRILAVDQSDTPGLPPLPHARAEVRLLAGRVPQTTVLAGDRASRAAMLNALPAHSFLHFSGHGSQDPGDSAGGALYCHDHEQEGPLTVADISRLRMDHAQLAFLSACETARGAARLPDEAVHLAGALQLAGFTHVVAAQWAVNDASALHAADYFYAGLTAPPRPGGPGPLDPSRAAIALHRTVQQLRELDHDPLSWAAYVHIGP